MSNNQDEAYFCPRGEVELVAFDDVWWWCQQRCLLKGRAKDASPGCYAHLIEGGKKMGVVVGSKYSLES